MPLILISEALNLGKHPSSEIPSLLKSILIDYSKFYTGVAEPDFKFIFVLFSIVIKELVFKDSERLNVDKSTNTLLFNN